MLTIKSAFHKLKLVKRKNLKYIFRYFYLKIAALNNDNISRKSHYDFSRIELKDIIDAASPDIPTVIMNAEKIIKNIRKIFNKEIVLDSNFDIIDKHFEKMMAKDVRIRWEIERMQFLPTLSLAYCFNKNELYLDYIKSVLKNYNQQKNRNTNAMEMSIRTFNILVSIALIWKFIENDKNLIYEVNTFCSDTEYYIKNNLELSITGIRGNHYITNLFGILLIKLLKANHEQREIEKVIQEIENEIWNQFDSDSFHIEHASGYHIFVVEQFLTLYALSIKNNFTFTRKYETKLIEILFTTENIIGLRDDFPRLGDYDSSYILNIGDYFNRAVYFQYLNNLSRLTLNHIPPHQGRRIKEPLIHLRNTKLIKYATQKYSFLATYWDVGTYGYGNHQHNDILSFVVNHKQESFLVDPGLYCYTLNPEDRNYSRSTKSHNTIMIEDTEINDFKPDKLFEMYENTKPLLRSIEKYDSHYNIEVLHDGYKKLSKSMIHTRKFKLFQDKIIVRDKLATQGCYDYLVNFNISEKYAVHTEKNRVLLKSNSNMIICTFKQYLENHFVGYCIPKITEGYYFPYYLEKLSIPRLEICSKTNSSNIIESEFEFV